MQASEEAKTTPAGGYLADYAKRKGWGRKTMLVSITLSLWNLIGEMGLSFLRPSAARCATQRGTGRLP